MPVEPKPPAPRALSVKASHFDQFGLFVAGDHHLGDLVAARDPERLVAVIDQDRLDLAAIVAVDGARRIEAGDAVIERQARARPHLRLDAQRQFDGDAAGHRHALAGQQFDLAHPPRPAGPAPPRRAWRNGAGAGPARAPGV